jgi:hypothetical protein
MDDKELLKLAAKAAGIVVPGEGPWSGVNAVDGVYVMNCDGTRFERSWNPLRDDGDAFRLQARLLLNVYHDGNLVDVHGARFGKDIYATEQVGNDRCAAARRAITRAAAEIGKTM